MGNCIGISAKEAVTLADTRALEKAAEMHLNAKRAMLKKAMETLQQNQKRYCEDLEKIQGCVNHIAEHISMCEVQFWSTRILFEFDLRRFNQTKMELQEELDKYQTELAKYQALALNEKCNDLFIRIHSLQTDEKKTSDVDIAELNALSAMIAATFDELSLLRDQAPRIETKAYVWFIRNDYSNQVEMRRWYKSQAACPDAVSGSSHTQV